MGQHGMSCIAQQYDFPIHISPLAEQFSIIQPPLSRPMPHARDYVLQRRIPPGILGLQLAAWRAARPAFPQLAELLFGLGDERNDVERLVAGDREDEKVLVRRQPGDGVRCEGPGL
jgi:hypothetical protein